MEHTTGGAFEYWSAKRVQKATGYSRVSLWRKSRDPNDNFPVPYQCGPNRVAWRSDEIVTWLNNRPRVNYAASPDVATA